MNIEHNALILQGRTHHGSSIVYMFTLWMSNYSQLVSTSITDIEYINQTLENTKSYKYLGILFTSPGKFSQAQTDLYKRGLKAMFKLINWVSLPTRQWRLPCTAERRVRCTNYAFLAVVYYVERDVHPRARHSCTSRYIVAKVDNSFSCRVTDWTLPFHASFIS